MTALDLYLNCTTLLQHCTQTRTSRTQQNMLRHGRDVHPTWVEGRVPRVILTSTGVRFGRLRSKEGLR